MLFGRPTDDGRKAAKIRDVKDRVREALALPPDTTVMVTELRCAEPGCPPVETVVAVLRGAGERQQARVPRAVADLDPADVASLCAALAAPVAPDVPGGAAS